MYESQCKPRKKVKQKKKEELINYAASQHEKAGDARGKNERVAREHKQNNSKNGQQKAPRENSIRPLINNS